jgi:hypothetical protein
VLGGIQQHPLERHPVFLDHVSPLGDRDSSHPQPFGQLVPDLLELAEREQPRLRGPILRERDAAHPVGGHECIGQLCLEPRDLETQRAARRAFRGLQRKRNLDMQLVC